MTFLNDKRAVSEVLGAILVFGILVAALGLYQAFIVPQATQQAEFSHNQELQQDFLDLRSSIHIVERTGSAQSFSMKLATDYSDRIVAINPPTPIGTLRTMETSNVTISHIEAVDRDERAYWQFSQTASNSFESSILVFEPRYNEYRTAPTTYLDHSVIHHEFDNGAEIIATEQTIIDGKRINLGFIGGNRTYSNREANLELQPISTGTTTVPVRAAGDNLTIELSTQLSEDKWQELLEDQLVSNGGYVEDFEVSNDGILTIELKQGITYDLQMAKVGIGPEVEDAEAHYIVRHGGDEKAIERTQEADLVAQVRDKFNNPVSGEDVTFRVVQGDATLINESTTDPEVMATSNANGLATVTVRPEKNNQTVEVAALIGDGNDPREQVIFRLTVGEANPSRFAEQLNPATGVIFEEAVASSGLSGGADSMFVTFNNTLDSGISIEMMRVNVYVPQTPGGSGRNKPYPDEMVATDDDGDSANYVVRGSFRSTGPMDTTFAPGELKTYEFEFSADGDTYQIKSGDYVIVSVVFDDDTSSTYIISPQSP